MTVAELVGMLAGQDQNARVLIFDDVRDGILPTIDVNCVMSMNYGSGPIVILQHDAEEAERLAELKGDA